MAQLFNLYAGVLLTTCEFDTPATTAVLATRSRAITTPCGTKVVAAGRSRCTKKDTGRACVRCLGATALKALLLPGKRGDGTALGRGFRFFGLRRAPRR